MGHARRTRSAPSARAATTDSAPAEESCICPLTIASVFKGPPRMRMTSTSNPCFENNPASLAAQIGSCVVAGETPYRNRLRSSATDTLHINDSVIVANIAVRMARTRGSFVRLTTRISFLFLKAKPGLPAVVACSVVLLQRALACARLCENPRASSGLSTSGCIIRKSAYRCSPWGVASRLAASRGALIEFSHAQEGTGKLIDKHLTVQ